MTDNKGQRIEFTYVNNAVSNATIDVAKYIDIDTDYDGVTFDPEYRLTYDYEENTEAPKMALISEVQLTDNAATHTETIAKYTYDATLYPPRLLEVYDGRLDGTGAEFPYATFTYHDVYEYDRIPAASSEHFGGADKFSFGIPTPTSASVTNPLGRVTDFTLAEVEQQARITQLDGVATPNCLAASKAFDYTPGTGEPEGYVYSRTEKNGSETTFTRNSRGLVLTKTEDATGTNPRVTTYTWHADLRLPLTRTTTEMIETFTYNVTTDGEVQLTTYSQTDDLTGSPTFGQVRTWTYSYTTLTSGVIVLSSVDGPGLVADGVTDVTSYDYDADANLTKITDPNGLETEFLNLSKMGQPTLIKGPDGIEWGIAYDHRGRVTSVTHDPNGSSPSTASYTYDVIGQMLSYTDLLGRTTSFDYDEARRLVKTTNPVGDVAEFEYDLAGNLTRTEYSDGTNPATFWAETEYDELGRLLKTVGAMGQEWKFAHDEEDNLDSITDPDLLQVSHTFDALNRLTDTVDRASQTTSMDHNEADQVTEYTDPRSIDTDFTYNGFGEVLSEVSADRGTMSYTYNRRGLVTSITDGNSVVTNYSYDNGGRLTARSFPSDTTLNETYTYNTSTAPADLHRLGKLSQISDGSGTTARDYATDTGYISSETRTLNSIAYQTQYALDLEGNLTTLTYPSGHVITYTYDNMNRVTRVQVDLGGGNADIVQAGASYLPNGPLNSLTYGDGAVLTADYDLSYRLTGLEDDLSGTKLRDITYGWTARDNLLSVTNALDPLDNRLFDYTSREKLEDADGPWGELDYTYDGVGNRLTRLLTVSGSTTTDTYTYPLTSNLLQSVAGGQTRAFTYDAAGNVTYDSRSGVGYGYAYNAANRMESMSLSGVVQAEYEYNALGQQVIRNLTQAGQIIHSVHDLDGNRIAEYDYDDVAGTSTLIREYVWMNGQVVAVIEGGAVYHVRTDHIGRPVFATNGSGTKVWEASYLPFGGVHTSTGVNINLRFPGQWFQSEAGLNQNWMRDYDPTLGRYIQADPLGLIDGASIYGYALQNPGRYVDPRGEQVRTDSLGSLRCFILGTCIPQPAQICPQGEGLDPLLLLPPHVSDEADEKPYAGETPDDKPEDFSPVRGSPGKVKGSDGSYWEPERAGEQNAHAGSKWKRWPNKRNRDRYGNRDRESVRPDGSVR